MQKVAFVVSICLLLGSCQKAELIPSYPKDTQTRGAEVLESDSMEVKVDIDAKGWEDGIDVGFGFGSGEPEVINK